MRRHHSLWVSCLFFIIYLSSLCVSFLFSYPFFVPSPISVDLFSVFPALFSVSSFWGTILSSFVFLLPPKSCPLDYSCNDFHSCCLPMFLCYFLLVFILGKFILFGWLCIMLSSFTAAKSENWHKGFKPMSYPLTYSIPPPSLITSILCTLLYSIRKMGKRIWLHSDMKLVWGSVNRFSLICTSKVWTSKINTGAHL